MDIDWSDDIADRLRALNAVELSPKSGAKYVLCWVQQTLRAWDNPLIDAAIELGNTLGLPVLVYHGVREDYPYASDRLHHFLIHASRDLQQNCVKRGLRCVSYVEREGHREKGLVYRLAESAVAVLTDDHPTFVARAQANRFAAKCERPMFAVDTARLVPTRMLPVGLNTTPAFRKASGALRSEYEAHRCNFAAEVPSYDGNLCFADLSLRAKTDDEIAAIIAECDIDHSLPPALDFTPTAKAALCALDDFVANRLKIYPYRRNNPAEEDGVSRLSPYLHFGVIGPRTITAAVRASDVPANAKWKYLDELLTWREYFHYQAYQHEIPDSFATLPEKPRLSLLAHAYDERPVLYTLCDLVHGRTDDETWNAAQRQWLETGYMHNNLRMYWGKQIIKWTRDPEIAWKTACYLNDRLALDGRDPATYGNMRWVFGMSKPSWQEQPIYGWVPPKSDRAIRKRDGATDWLKDWATRDIVSIYVPDNKPEDAL
ncbi:deoxyribodipyrimidine photo-lyase [Sedimentitalea todarodis]|uniref:Photolyase/cryptochrome alpha/beta domain-containing protein n=1 Tax=Sedimentitalea todarodis TaxID=1631240 RepID=A0ABU3VKU4_9RHOB|nr:deoxyribodipyrimidine photo-lyase [Sedimentitalea todarodis]MDU9006791.1 hypothetical protein [Sedimentitalea todarodis]